MALMSCPECGGKVSDMAQSCPHCGYPIYNTVQDDELADYFNLILKSVSANQDLKLSAIRTIREIKSIGLAEAMALINNVPSIILSHIKKDDAQKIGQELKKRGCQVSIEKTNSQTFSEQDIAKEFVETIGKVICPRCHSTAITTGTKGYGLIRGFLGSNKTVNRCGSCGYSWEP